MHNVRAGDIEIWHEIVGSGPRLKERFQDPTAYAHIVEFLGA